jgi:hypothetical protein
MTDTISTSAEALEAAALPRRRDVHTAETASEGPAALSSKPLQQKSPAEWAYERLTLYIQKFEEMLDDEHEVAMGMTGGDAGVLRIEGMGYFDPDMVTFYGRDPSGARTQLVQHVTQLNVMLRAMPKAAPQEPKPRRIGFQLAKELEDGAAT